MKKVICAVIALSFLIALPVFAEEMAKDEMPGVKGMGKMCAPMMPKAQMVATDEGGVIVLAGNKLMKYDADLNLVKDVEISMPMPMMGKQCPLMGKMAQQKAPEAQATEKKI